MSATRCPLYLEPRVGMPVRVDRVNDPQDGALGWVTELEQRTAHLDFGGGTIARWFAWEDLTDERICRTEQVIAVGRAVSLTPTPGLLTTLGASLTSLAWLERETTRRQNPTVKP